MWVSEITSAIPWRLIKNTRHASILTFSEYPANVSLDYHSRNIFNGSSPWNERTSYFWSYCCFEGQKDHLLVETRSKSKRGKISLSIKKTTWKKTNKISVTVSKTNLQPPAVNSFYYSLFIKETWLCWLLQNIETETYMLLHTQWKEWPVCSRLGTNIINMYGRSLFFY